MMAARQLFPDLFKAPEETPKQDTSGLKAAASAGLTRLGGEFELLKGKAGFKDQAEAQREYEAAEKKASERFTPTEKGWSEDPFLKFRETLGGSLPSMVAPAAAGLAALALPVSAPVAIGAGLLGAGAVSAGQFTGSNLSRQVGTGKSLEEASGAAALGAAIPQALVDTAAMALIPGVGKLFGSVGSKLTTEQAKAIASQTLGKAAADYTAKTGLAMGREGFTEVVQQSLERLQAGLNIADPDAREEYIESFIGGAVLGGAIAPVGRAIERSGAKTQAARAERDERNVAAKEAAEQERLAKEQQTAAEKQQAAQEEAERNSAPYAMQVGQQYDALLQEFQTKKTALKNPGKDATPVEKAEYKDAQKEVQDLNAQIKEIVPEYRRTAPIRKQAQEQARKAGMDPFDYMLEQTGEVPTYTQSTPGTLPEVDMEGIPGAASDQPTRAAEKMQGIAQYVAERFDLAQEQLINPTTMELVDYLAQDPVMAARIVETKTPMPGMSRSESTLLRNALGKTLTAQAEAQEAARQAQGMQGTAASQQRISEVEAEEQAALEAQRAEGQRAAEEAQREQALGGEYAALQRMGAPQTGSRGVFDEAAPYSLGANLSDQFSLFGTEQPAPAGSAAMGQMQQKLTGEDVTFTADEEKPRNLQRVPGAEFKLRGRNEGTAPVTREELADRINTVLSTYDLSPEAVDLLQRAEKALPAANTVFTQKRVAETTKGTKTDEAKSAGFFDLLDQQLARIESGAEGVPRKGQSRTLDLQTFPPSAEQQAQASTTAPTEAGTSQVRQITGAQPGQAASGLKTPIAQPDVEDRRTSVRGAADVTKRVADTAPSTLRGPSAKPVPVRASTSRDSLTLVNELEPLLRVVEEAAQADTGQKSLFGEKDEAVRAAAATAEGKPVGMPLGRGYVKGNRGAFQMFMKSKFVQNLRQQLRRDEEIAKRAQAIPALEKRASALVAEIEDILKQYAEYRDADAIVKANKDVAKAKRDMADIRAAAGKATVDRMLLAGAIEDLKQSRKQVIEQGYGEGGVQELLANIDAVNAQLQDAQTDMALLNSALSVLDGQLQSFAAVQKLAARMEKAPSVERIDQAKQELRAVQTELGVLQEENKKLQNRMRKDAADKRRADEAVRQAERNAQVAAGRIKPAEQALNNLPLYDKATQYPALTEAQLLAREKGGTLPDLTAGEKIAIGGDPARVLGGYRARITALEKTIRQSQDKSKAALGRDMVEPKQNLRDALAKAYKQAKSATERDALGPKLDVAEAELARAKAELSNTDVIWVGMKSQIKQLADVIAREEWLSGMISEGRIELEAPAAAKVRAKPTAEEREQASARRVEDASVRTTGASTSGEPLTRSEAAKARQPQKTLFEGKGEPGGAAVEIGGPTTLEKLQASARERMSKGLFFSRGTPVNGLTGTELRSELDKAVGDENAFGRKVSVFNTVQEFLDARPRYNGKIPFDAKGFVDPKSGRAYLFAENIAKGEGLGILLHEVGVHLGFRNFFNAGQFNAIAKVVRNWANAPANTLEGKIGRAAAKRAKDAGTSAAQIDDELIAYAVEEAVKAGVEPAGVKGGSAVQNWLRMIVNAFNKALETLGLAPEKLKVGDLVNMAYGAAQLEIKGTWHGTGKLFKEFDHKYMGTGEGAQAFSWGTYRAQSKGVAGVYQGLGARKQVEAWLQQPEIVAWMASQKPRYGGKTAEDFAKFAAEGAPGKSLVGVPFEMATGMQLGLDKYAKELAEGEAYPLTPADALKIALKYAHPTGSARRALRAWVETADMSPATAPHPNPLYKGRRTYTLDSTVESDVARDVLRIIEAPDVWGLDASQPPKELIKVAAELARTQYAESAAYGGTTDYFKKQTKEAKEKLKVLDKLDLADVTYNPPTPAPLPRPTGNMLRTLHGRKENEYLQWDLPENAQPPVVSKALKQAVEGLDREARRKYDAILAPLTRGNRVLKGADIYEALGGAMESNRAASELLHSFGVAGTKFLDRKSRSKRITDRSTYNYVDYSDKEEGAAIVAADINPVGPAEGLLFSRGAPADALESLSKKIIAQPKTLKEKLGSNLALQLEMQGVDMRAGLRDTLKFGDDNLFTQAMYHVRKAEQKMAQMFTVMNSGPLVAYKDSKGLTGYRSSNQNSAREVFDAISDIPVDNPQLKTDLAQTYLVAVRANNKGLPKLDLGAMELKQADLDAALAAAEANPALKSALENVRRKYSAYNKGMIEFLASTGRISKKEAADLLKEGDYVPFYRVDKNGKAALVFNNNVKFNVGDIRRQPYLAELKGGDTKLLPLNEAIQRNTLLLTDMALTNNAAKSVAYGLQALGKGKGPVDPKTGKPSNVMAIKPGFGPDDASVIRFYQEPDPSKPDDDGKRHILVDTTGTLAEGIPAELVVQSLEGASLALPGFFKLGGIAADWLRAGVTRTPLYIARKLIREPMAASFTGGLESNTFSSVFKAGAEFLRMSTGSSDAQAKLIEKGLIQSNIFAGDMSDMKKMALQLASGKDQNVWEKVFAAADRYAMRADAATLALVLKNAEASGLSEVEADMATMESMNFYKRGLSPTLQYASRLIPFFNAQIQGLNVLVKAARGNMPFEEQQEIKRKFLNNALLLTFTGVAYAMAMEDDETFRNARPRDKYSNFFMPIPGVDEPLKLPIPFEAGYFFSLAVAAVDSMRAETDGKAQWQAIRDLFLGSIPGYSSMGIPQIAKPALEVWSNKNFLTGGAVESLRLQGLDTEERYLATTTELAKQMSKAVPLLSPIQIEHIVRGYFGVMPLAAVAAANNLFAREDKGEKPAGRASDLPLVGTAFQKKYGGADADVVFREADEAMTARTTLNKMLSEGRREEAAEYRDKHRVELAMASAAGQYRQVIGRINADVRRTQERNDLTPEEKRLRLDELDKARQGRAEAFIKMQRAIEARQGTD
jgi:hypothetical protein